MMKIVLLGFLYLCCLASCCQRRDDVMVCQQLPTSPRLEGVRVLIIARVLTNMLNLRAYDVDKVMVQFSSLHFDQVLTRPGTKVFLGDRLCTHASTDRQKSDPSTTTAMMETAAIGFNIPWIIVTGISSLAISYSAICVCVVIVRKHCARRKSLQRLSAAMDDISVSEFGYENVKLD
eukprot:XP_019930301.1 PREDICTED: uncharacterized protein LOC105346755 isoform X1 [Crassostrea gigas]